MNTQTTVFQRHAKGERPHFFNDPAIDQMLTFFVELTTEVSVLRDRLSTIELLLDKNGTLNRDDIEDFRPDDAAEKHGMEQRKAFLERVFRMHSQDSGAAA